MKLEVELTLIERYEVKIDGKSIGEFEKDSEWEGMSRLKNNSGVIVIDGGESVVFESIFKGLVKPEPTKHNVVKITPSLIPVK